MYKLEVVECIYLQRMNKVFMFVGLYNGVLVLVQDKRTKITVKIFLQSTLEGCFSTNEGDEGRDV